MNDLLFLLGPPLGALLIGIMMWLLDGRDPKNDDPIVPSFDPPEGMTVIEAGVLVDDLLQSRDLVYELYDLYFKGIISFEENTYLKLLKGLESPQVQALPVVQQAVLQLLFKRGASALRLDSGMARFRAAEIKNQVYAQMTNKGWYSYQPNDQRKLYYLIAYGLIIGGIGFNVVMFFSMFDLDTGSYPFFLPWSLVGGLVAAGLIFGIYGRTMAQKTVEGVKKLKELLGFKQFIMTAEKDRIEYFLQNDPLVYKKVLPYAFLFGVQERWLAPATDLREKLMQDDIKSLTFDMDLDAFEEAFEEKHNPLFFIVNIFVFAVFKAAKFAIFGMGRKYRYRENEPVAMDMTALGADDTENQIEKLERLRDFDDGDKI